MEDCDIHSEENNPKEYDQHCLRKDSRIALARQPGKLKTGLSPL